jgi:nucleoside-diphosphate-sugar epimerase
MTYLLTGSSGFLGKHFIEFNENLEAKLDLVLISSVEFNKLPTIKRTGSRINYLCTDKKKLNEVSHIIHAGSFIPKNRAEANNVQLSDESLNFTSNLLELNLPSLKKIVYFSSVDVYLRNKKRINEFSETAFSNEYIKMKIESENMLQKYCSQNGITLHILRIGHIYGQGDHIYKKIIPSVFNSLFFGKPLELTSGISQTVNLLYVKDFLKILYNLLIVDEIEGISNIVSSYPVSLQNIIELTENISNKKLMINQKSENYDNTIYDFEPSNLVERLNYFETSIYNGLLETYRFYIDSML